MNLTVCLEVVSAVTNCFAGHVELDCMNSAGCLCGYLQYLWVAVWHLQVACVASYSICELLFELFRLPVWLATVQYLWVAVWTLQVACVCYSFLRNSFQQKLTKFHFRNNPPFGNVWKPKQASKALYTFFRCLSFCSISCAWIAPVVLITSPNPRPSHCRYF